jgi:hypothetical protein
MIRLSVLLVALLVFASSAPALAQTTSTDRRSESLETPRGLALGTGVRASAVSTAALAYNQAGMPLSKLYHLEGLVGFAPSTGLWTLGASVVDSNTNNLAAGLAFRGLIGSEDDGYSGLDGQLALAYPLAEFLSLGLGARYVWLTTNAQLPEGMDDTLVQGFTLDASVVVQPVDGLRIAAYGSNLIDLESSLAPLQVGGSAAFTYESVFTIGADVLVDLTTFEQAQILAGGGVELLAAGKVPIRLGYVFDSGRQIHSVSGGLGYLDTSWGAELSLRQDVAGASDTAILASFRYFVQ